ncbi:tyrosine-type recombinase/integrase [Bacteriovoracaceae bacterium]|nr:tyrosine-type recombinase/integrase [Bacteriovoracaceae bacterium]|tara:strand:+ start:58501 stop:59499 length:999 start_codon:yes stop_codon:yes gene_type:complete
MGQTQLKESPVTFYGYTYYEEFFENFTSINTRKSYASDLSKFFLFLTENFKNLKKYNSIERKHIITYRNYLSETGGHDGNPCAPKTVARKLAALSSYFDFLVEKDECKFNPVGSVKRPRREVLKPTQALNTEQVRALFAAIVQGEVNEHGEAMERTPSSILHRALMVTFFTTGLRKSEILNLKLRHYREINDDKVIEYIGKGAKVGQKLIHPMCEEAIQEYLSWMKSQGREVGPEDWLFQPTRNPSDPKNLNKPLNPRTINEIIDKYAKKIGLNFKISPHSARATFIGELLDAGVDIYSVAREVNHSSVKTTQEYDKRRRRIKDSPIGKLRY